MYRAGDRVAIGISRDELPLPASIQIGSLTIETPEDLVAFTGLPRATVLSELQHRRPLSFRSEWLATPKALRYDDWFYLSSKGPMSSPNASHAFHDVLDLVATHVPSGGKILEFGGGTGRAFAT